MLFAVMSIHRRSLSLWMKWAQPQIECLCFPSGWLCDRVCGGGDRLWGVPATYQTCPWKPCDQLLHAHPHQGNIRDMGKCWNAAPSKDFKPCPLPGSGDRRWPQRKLISLYEPQLQPKLWNPEVDGERRCSHRSLCPLWHRLRWVLI